MELQSVAAYARQIKPALPESAFAPARSRVLWLPVHAAIIGGLAWALATGQLPWWAWPLASLVIGFCLAGVTFLGHETLHGGVVRGQASRSASSAGSASCRSRCRRSCGWRGTTASTTTTAASPGSIPTCTRRSRSTTRSARARIMADYFGIGRRRADELPQHPVRLHRARARRCCSGARKRGFLTREAVIAARSFETAARRRVLGHGRRARRLRAVPVRVRAAARGRELDRDGVHHDEPQPVAR